MRGDVKVDERLAELVPTSAYLRMSVRCVNSRVVARGTLEPNWESAV